GSSLVYIGYLVVSSLQLGATIDYGILLSNRYMENRASSSPTLSAIHAIKTAGVSVTVSALILAVAGYGFGMVSRISAVSEIGILLGRGAVISAAMVLGVLPPLLVICDRLIRHTTSRVRATLAD
ncbi:MAG: MMPL family transporter, partial [Bacillota bacterium]